MDLKEILQHNYNHTDTHLLIRVPLSRFKLIFNSYRALCGLDTTGVIEEHLISYKDYTLHSIKGKTNSYQIVKTDEKEVKGKCNDCNCGRTRFINPLTNDCYYNEAIKNNYTTKLTHKL